MRSLVGLGVVFLAVACADEEPSIGPDPSKPTGTGGAPSSSSSGGGGSGGHAADGGGGSGASGGGEVGLGWESGSRLKVRYLEAGDGARQATGWFDSERGEECIFTRSTDGEMRCLPSGLQANVTAGFFSDAACTQPIAISTCAGSVYAFETIACSGQRRIYQLGAALSTIYVGAGCTSSPTSPGLNYYAVGPEVPPSSFVRAEEQTEP
jgi:hypothetical protein